MRNQKRTWLNGIIVVLALLSFVTFPGKSVAQKPAIINFGLLGDFTGPYASISGPIATGFEDSIEYVNKELGGIDGVKLNGISRDNGGNAALGLQQYAELIGMKPKPLFFHVPITPLAEALREKLRADNAIGFFPSSIADLYPHGNTYGYYALYPEQAAVAVKWVKDSWKEKRNPRIGIITYDTSFGRAILTEEFLNYCKNIGVDIVATELFGIRDVSVSTHLARMRSKEPDWLLTSTVGSGPLAIMKAAKELGMNAKLLGNVAFDWATLRLDPGLFEGCVTILPHVSYDEMTHPGIQTILGYMKKYNRKIDEKSMHYVLSWQNVLLAHKSVKDAVAKVGWDKLNVAAITNVLNHLSNYEPLNGVIRTSYTEKRRTPSWVTINRMEGGKIVSLSPGYGFIEVPDLRPAEYR
jgi:branched-chain amino acid transport system substrate-binding protein